MKKIISLILLFISFNLIRAQEEGGDVGWVARFGIAGGITPTWIIPNLDPVNVEIKRAGLEELSNSGMVLWGGGGYAYIMFVDNLRIGGIGLSGTASTDGKVGNMNKEIKYNYGFGGLTVEYTLPFVKYVGVSVGAIIGAGSQSIEIYQNSGSQSWRDIWDKVNSGGIVMTNNVSDEITDTFFLFTPTLNVDIPINRFVALRIGGGYTLTLGNDWSANNDNSTSGVPDDLDANNFFIQTGIYFGFFAY